MHTRVFFAVLCLLPGLLLAPGGVFASHPNHSIDPQPPPPTRYGLTIVRADDDRYPLVESPVMAPDGAIDMYLASVAAAELDSGPYSPALVAPLQDIGLKLQAAGRHRRAIDQYKRALHLIRVNGGLYDPTQISLLHSLAESYVAMGQLEAADDTRNYLYRVQEENYPPGSPEMYRAAEAHAEWKREFYLEGYGFETYLNLLDIHRVHSRVIDEISLGDEYSLAQVPHLYQRMRSEYLMSRYEGEAEPTFQVHTSGFSGERYAVNTSLDREKFRILKKHNFRNGRMTMERVVDVLEQQRPMDPQALAQAKIALGDWFMWWDQPARARECYEEAWALWAEDPSPATDPLALFEQPVELPEDRIFQPGLLSEEPQHNARAVVKFDVSRLGQVMDIEYLEVETEDPAKAETARLALHRMLRDFRFRPIVRDGRVVAADGLVREYRFEY